MTEKEKKEKEQKREKRDTLDTETTFADMNVEGLSRHRPKRQKEDVPLREPLPPLSREERRAMMRGAFRAFLPLLLGTVLVMGALIALAYLWLH